MEEMNLQQQRIEETAEQRRKVRDYILQGLSVRQISNLMKRPIGTVRGYVARVLHDEEVSSMAELQALALLDAQNRIRELEQELLMAAGNRDVQPYWSQA